MKVEFRNRPTGSFALIARERDKHGGPSELFHQSGRHYSDHARMPGVVGKHDGEHLVEIHRQYFLAGLLEGRVIYVLTPLIQLLELARNRVRLVLVLREKELDSPNRVSEPTRRVQSRRQDESDSAGRELLAIETGRSQQRAHSNVAGFRQHFETVADEYAILAAKRRDVSYRRQRHQIQHRPHEVLVAAESARESERELERDADGREILVRVSVATSLRI